MFSLCLLCMSLSYLRYQNSVSVEKKVYKNVKLFMDNKNDGDDLFDRLNVSSSSSSSSSQLTY